MSDFDIDNWTVDSFAEGMLETFDVLESDVQKLTEEEKANLVCRIAKLLEVPAIVYSPADLVAVSTNWRDDEMTEAELLDHRELAAHAYPLLPRLLQKAEPDYSVLEWALATAQNENNL